MPRFTPAGQAEILRAAQKDEMVVSALADRLAQLVLEAAGNSRRRRRLSAVARTAARYAYYLCTTVAGYQTVGEEYSGVVLVDGQGALPSRLALLWMVFLKCSGAAAAASLLAAPETLLSHLGKLHAALFYLRGGRLDPAKTLAGVHYVLVRFWRRDRATLPLFRLLGAVTLASVVIRACVDWRRDAVDVAPETAPGAAAATPGTRCYYCLEKRKDTCATPCGHLFCWRCLMDGLRVKEECPVCREVVQPSRVILLQNYDSLATE